MAGFREFVTGEVLTAANVDDFLMKQSVQKYADAAARDAALGTAVAGGNALREGMVAWIDADDRIQYYDGTAWENVPNEADVNAAGGLVEVKSAIFTGTQTGSVTAGNNLSVTDLTITHEVADAANRLIISAFLGAAGNSEGAGNVGIAIHDGAGLIAIGASPGNRVAVTAGGRVSAAPEGDVVTMASVTFVHTPGAGSKTFTVRAINISDTTRTLYINRTSTDTDNALRTRAVSSLVIQEVKV